MGRVCLLLGLLAFAACDQRTHGTVISKGRNDASTLTTYTPTYDAKGNFTGLIPSTISLPETYWLEVRSVNEKGQVREEKFYVTHDELDRTRIGDVFDCGAPGKECVQ